MPSAHIVNPTDLQEEEAGLIRSAESEQKLDIPVLLTALHEGRGIIARFTAGAFLAGVLLAFVLPVKYTATASFIPPGSDLSGSSSLTSRLTGLGAGLLGNVKSSGDLYVGLLKSRAVVDRLIGVYSLKAEYGTSVTSKAANILADNTKIMLGTKDPIVSVSVTDKSPQRAQELANGYLTALQEVKGSLSLTENSQRRFFYEQRLQQEKTALANAEVALKQTQESTGIISPAGQTAVGIEEVAQLRAQVAAHQVQLAALRQSETDDNPNVQLVHQELGSLQSQITQMEKSQTGGPAGAPSQVQVPALELEYVRKLREVKFHETLFDILAKQYESARLDEAQDTPLQILDHAAVPDVKSGPPRMLIVLSGTILGFLGGSGWVLLRKRIVAIRASLTMPTRA